ncbi:MAG: FHA domain-containing protein [Spirochaetaceae bacterium]|nr:MAG: FHA domain-containing protein [Spirochaetaceae bacterium]
MSILIRRLVYLCMGVLGGLAVWPAVELMLSVQHRFPTYLLFSLTSGAMFGAIMGGFFGMIDGMIAGAARRILSGAGFGVLIGAGGGALGFLIGQMVLFLLSDPDVVGIAVSRALGWAVLGLCVGASEGIRRMSWRRAAMGIVGGFLGGLLGGTAIEIVPFWLPEAVARPAGLVVFGFLVSGMYSLVESWQSRGLLRLLNGLYKGKEFILNQRSIRIGASRGSDVFLAGYSRVAERHAEVRELKGELSLVALSEDHPTKINDEQLGATSQRVLKFDDVIQIGSAKFLFRPLLVLWLVFLGTLVVGPGRLHAQNLRVAQVNTARLLTYQTVDIYLGITDADGNPIEGIGADQLRVYESPDGLTYTEVPVLAVEERAAETEGITVLLLVDNSGSMYATVDGRPTQDPAATRMAGVRGAIRSFLAEIDHPRDRVALAEFNTHYTLLTEATDSLRTVELLLDTITRPRPQDAYTELYRAISLATESLESGEGEGRRALLVLTDGENYPFTVHSGQPHPVYGDELVTAEETLEHLQRSAVGVFGISFAGGTDPMLQEIANAGGGLVYDAADGDELGAIYSDIRERILQEYRVRYRAAITPTEQRYLRVVMELPEGTAEQERSYFAGTLFGLPRDDFGPLFGIPFLVAVLLAAALARLRFLNRRSSANVEILDLRGRSTQVLNLSGQQTVIGASADADITLSHSPDMQDKHATIVFDEKRGSYTVVSVQPVEVNNHLTTRRELEPGDVIQLPGATVVFDRPERPSRTE